MVHNKVNAIFELNFFAVIDFAFSLYLNDDKRFCIKNLST